MDDAEDRYLRVRDENIRLKKQVNKHDSFVKKLRTKVSILEQSLERAGGTDADRELVEARTTIAQQNEEIRALKTKMRSLMDRLRSTEEVARRRPGGPPAARRSLPRRPATSGSGHPTGATRQAWESQDAGRARSSHDAPFPEGSDPALRSLAARLQDRLVHLERRLQEAVAENQQLRAGSAPGTLAASSGDAVSSSGAAAHSRHAREAEARAEALRVRLSDLESHDAARQDLYERTVQALERQSEELRETRAQLQRAQGEAATLRDRCQHMRDVERSLSDAREENRRLEDQLQDLAATPFFREGEDRTQLKARAEQAERDVARQKDVVSHLQATVRGQHTELEALRRERRELNHALEDAKDAEEEAKQRADSASRGASALREHLSLFTGADGDPAGVPLEDLEEALTIVRRGRDRPQHVTDLGRPGISATAARTAPPGSKDAAIDLQQRLRDARSAEMTAIQRVDRVERMLKTQREYTQELEAEVRDLTERAGGTSESLQRKVRDLESLCQRKEDRIQSLRDQLDAVLHRRVGDSAQETKGGEGAETTADGGGTLGKAASEPWSVGAATLQWDSGADLSAGENALEIFLGTVTWLAGGDEGENRDLMFALLDFFDFESQASPLRALSSSVNIEFAAEFRFQPDDSFLQFLCREHAEVELMRVTSGGDAELAARGILPLRELLVQPAGETVFSAIPLRGREGQVVGILRGHARLAVSLVPHWKRLVSRFPDEEKFLEQWRDEDAEQMRETMQLQRQVARSGRTGIARISARPMPSASVSSLQAQSQEQNELQLRLVALEGIVSHHHAHGSPSLFVELRFSTALGFEVTRSSVAPPAGPASEDGSIPSVLFEESWRYPIVATADYLAALRDGAIQVVVADASDPADRENSIQSPHGRPAAVVGRASVALNAIAEGLVVDNWFSLVSPSGGASGRVRIRIQWRDAARAVTGPSSSPGSITRRQWSAWLSRFQGPRRGGIRAMSVLRCMALSPDAYATVQEVRQLATEAEGRGEEWGRALQDTSWSAGRAWGAVEAQEIASVLGDANKEGVCVALVQGLQEAQAMMTNQNQDQRQPMASSMSFPVRDVLELIRPANPQSLAAEGKLRSLVQPMSGPRAVSLRQDLEDRLPSAEREALSAPDGSSRILWEAEWSRDTVMDWAQSLGAQWVQDPVEEATMTQYRVPHQPPVTETPKQQEREEEEEDLRDGAVSPLSSIDDADQDVVARPWMPPSVQEATSTPSLSAQSDRVLPTPIVAGVCQGIWHSSGSPPSLQLWVDACREAWQEAGESAPLSVPILQKAFETLHLAQPPLLVTRSLLSLMDQAARDMDVDSAVARVAKVWERLVARVSSEGFHPWLAACSEAMHRQSLVGDPDGDAISARERLRRWMRETSGVEESPADPCLLLRRHTARRLLETLEGVSTLPASAASCLWNGLDPVGMDDVDMDLLLAWWEERSPIELAGFSRSSVAADHRARALSARRHAQFRRFRRARGQPSQALVALSLDLPLAVEHAGSTPSPATSSTRGSSALGDEFAATALDAAEEAVRGWLAAAWMEDPSRSLSDRLRPFVVAREPVSGGLTSESSLDGASLGHACRVGLQLPLSDMDLRLVVEKLDTDGTNMVSAASLDAWVMEAESSHQVRAREQRADMWPILFTRNAFVRSHVAAWVASAVEWGWNGLSSTQWQRWAVPMSGEDVIVPALSFVWELRMCAGIPVAWAELARWGRGFCSESGVNVTAWLRQVQQDLGRREAGEAESAKEEALKDMAQHLRNVPRSEERVPAVLLRSESVAVDRAFVRQALEQMSVRAGISPLRTWLDVLDSEQSDSIPVHRIRSWLEEHEIIRPRDATAEAEAEATVGDTKKEEEKEKTPEEGATPGQEGALDAPPPAPGVGAEEGPKKEAPVESLSEEKEGRFRGWMVRMANSARASRRQRALGASTEPVGSSPGTIAGLETLVATPWDSLPDPRVVGEALYRDKQRDVLSFADASMALERLSGQERLAEADMKLFVENIVQIPLVKVPEGGADAGKDGISWDAVMASVHHPKWAEETGNDSVPSTTCGWVERVRGALRRWSKRESLSPRAMMQRAKSDDSSEEVEVRLGRDGLLQLVRLALSDEEGALPWEVEEIPVCIINHVRLVVHECGVSGDESAPDSEGLSLAELSAFVHDGSVLAWYHRLHARLLVPGLAKAGGQTEEAPLHHIRAMMEHLDRRANVRQRGSPAAGGSDTDIPLTHRVTRRRFLRAMRLLKIPFPTAEIEMLVDWLSLSDGVKNADAQLRYAPFVVLVERGLLARVSETEEGVSIETLRESIPSSLAEGDAVASKLREARETSETMSSWIAASAWNRIMEKMELSAATPESKRLWELLEFSPTSVFGEEFPAIRASDHVSWDAVHQGLLQLASESAGSRLALAPDSARSGSSGTSSLRRIAEGKPTSSSPRSSRKPRSLTQEADDIVNEFDGDENPFGSPTPRSAITSADGSPRPDWYHGPPRGEDTSQTSVSISLADVRHLHESLASSLDQVKVQFAFPLENTVHSFAGPVRRDSREAEVSARLTFPARRDTITGRVLRRALRVGPEAEPEAARITFSLLSGEGDRTLATGEVDLSTIPEEGKDLRNHAVALKATAEAGDSAPVDDVVGDLFVNVEAVAALRSLLE